MMGCSPTMGLRPHGIGVVLASASKWFASVSYAVMGAVCVQFRLTALRVHLFQLIAPSWVKLTAPANDPVCPWPWWVGPPCMGGVGASTMHRGGKGACTTDIQRGIPFTDAAGLVWAA